MVRCGLPRPHPVGSLAPAAPRWFVGCCPGLLAGPIIPRKTKVDHLGPCRRCVALPPAWVVVAGRPGGVHESGGHIVRGEDKSASHATGHPSRPPTTSKADGCTPLPISRTSNTQARRNPVLALALALALVPAWAPTSRIGFPQSCPPPVQSVPSVRFWVQNLTPEGRRARTTRGGLPPGTGPKASKPQRALMWPPS